MPSDPSGVQPKGVLTRAAADFFDDHLAIGSFFRPQQVGGDITWSAIALYNNANSGVVFKVYGVFLDNDVGDGASAFFQYGTIGTFQNSCQPIRPDVGMPYGQIWADLRDFPSPPPPNPFNFGPNCGMFGSVGFDSMTYFSAFPIAIVPRGYSYIFVNNQAAENVGASFWYQMANE